MMNLEIVDCLSSVGWKPIFGRIDLLLDKELGHVIAAHELAHYKLKHFPTDSCEQSWSQELEAWTLARKWLEPIGEWTAEAKFFARSAINTYRSECFYLAPVSKERKAIKEMDEILN